ncbi:alpha/beta hydrolase family protein [Paenibacillus luteus]|uniref:alpha/beta hydrolase family protein n=1 Tax=Paenibacillus luteus TaxID=2545753 RepID=UPI00114294B3|nr:dienelactone hydrolase [Paenibacillus luteus]
MRLFELLLLLSNVELLALSILRRSKYKLLLATSGASVLLLIIHLLVEGLRVQLLFPYCYTLVMFTISIYRFSKQTPSRSRHKAWGAAGYSLIALMLAATGALMYLFPLFKLPEPTGNLKIGTQTFHFIDEKREELFAEAPGGKREIMVQIWYPAHNTSGKPYPFLPNADQLLKVEPLSSAIGLPVMFMSYLKQIPTHSYANAEAANSSEAYPLVLLNHGFGMSKIYQTSQAENLASHGYIVASIDHTYSTFGTVFPDGTLTLLRTYEEQFIDKEYRDLVGKTWTDDVLFTLDQLERMNAGEIPSKVEGKMDLDHIGVFGHSFGGAASYDATYDPRIKAGINLDGSLYRTDRAGSSKPFMYMLAERTFDLYYKARQDYVYSDEELEEMGANDREVFEEQLQEVKVEGQHFANTAKNGGQVVYIENSEHYNFTDMQLLSPLFRFINLAGSISPARATSIVNAYTLDFFNKYLKNQGGRLVEGPTGDYPEVKFGTTLFAEGNLH